ncbi:MAG: hypothetical protein LBG80_06200 [Bacteroidales bacterium]|jgi:hypothetical protein|nr:hypothetical protein [Bacteroidales bacterium]
MTRLDMRNYKCKDEELPVIAGYAKSLLIRDLLDFQSFSPIFDQDYVDRFDKNISLVSELVSPKVETDESKKITKRLYGTMDSLLDPIDKVRTYLSLAKNTVGLSAKDFGLTQLGKKIRNKDAEGVHQNLLIVDSFLKKYKEPLVAVGLKDIIIEQFEAAIPLIISDNQLQFDIVSKRKIIVQNNREFLNELYEQLMEILKTGKSLYKNTNPAKSKEYSFNSLLKNVRVVHVQK